MPLNNLERIGIPEFLKKHEGMSLKPLPLKDSRCFLIKGEFFFLYESDEGPGEAITFEIEIYVPYSFPDDLPLVWEVGGKIPKEKDFHSSQEGLLCLGSPVRLRLIAHDNPSLEQYLEVCLVPYLHAIWKKLNFEEEMPFGELDHGRLGIIKDYMDLFGVQSEEHVMTMLKILHGGLKEAAEDPCPCGCGRKLEECSYRKKLNKNLNVIRNKLPTPFIEKILESLEPPKNDGEPQ